MSQAYRSGTRGLVALVAAIGMSPSADALGASERSVIRVARRIEEPRLAVANPLGLAYVPAADAFLVIPAQGLGAVQILSHTADPLGSDSLDLADLNALNSAFDAGSDRLLVVAGRELHAIAVRRNGRLASRATLSRYDFARFGVESPAGLAVDPDSGALFILDPTTPRLVRVKPDANGNFDAGTVTAHDLAGVPSVALRGLAFDHIHGDLLTLGGGRTLHRFSATGALRRSYDVSSAHLHDPGGLVFAPTGDLTDDPAAHSLYVADGPPAREPGETRRRHSSGGSIVELRFDPAASAGPSAARSTTQAVAAPEALTTFTSSVIRTVLTSQWTPPAPDTSDVVYMPATNTLRVVDSEVEEMGIWAGASEWVTNLDGTVIGTSNLTYFTNEPTGISVNPANDHLFYSDDAQKKVIEINPGPDGQYHTGDDTRTSFSTSAFGSTDPEDVTYNPFDGALYLADGVNAEVYRIAPGPNGLFDGVPSAGGDDVLTQFDTSAHTLDPECLTVNGENNRLYLGGHLDTAVQELSTSGVQLQTIDISAAGANKIGGLGFGPGSTDPQAVRLYLVQRGVDNNSNRNENDGKLWEMTAPSGSASNLPPTVNAGVDQTILQSAPFTLDATVIDDGLPNPPGAVTTTWSKLSGPGSVTFGNVNAVDTTASFSASGSYVLRLTASDGALNASDDVAIAVNPAGSLWSTKRGAIHSGTNGSSYAFPSIAASNNRLYVVFLSTSAASGATAPAATGVSGAGLSFSEIGAPGGLLFDGTTNRRRIQAWRALNTSGATTGAITISLAASSLSMDAVLLEFVGMDSSGVNGSGAVLQSATAKASVKSLAVPLAAFASPANRPVAFFVRKSIEVATPEAGYNELDDASHSSPTTGAQTEWHGSAADTTPSASWVTKALAGGFAIEVKAQP